jgi:hypothetical protein
LRAQPQTPHPVAHATALIVSKPARMVAAIREAELHEWQNSGGDFLSSIWSK